MAPYKEAKTKCIEVRFGGKRPNRCKHARKFTFAPTDTTNEVYDRIKDAFQSHVGESEIAVFHPQTGKKVDLQYHGLVNGGLYLLSVGAVRTYGAGQLNNAAKKTKRAVLTAMHLWGITDSRIRDGRYLLLPPSMAPLVPGQDDAVQDPYLWPNKFARSLKALSVKSQGHDGHEKVLQHLEAAIEERLRRTNPLAPPELRSKCLKTEDIVVVLHEYNQSASEAEKPEPEDGADMAMCNVETEPSSDNAGGRQQVLQHTLAFRPHV